MQRVRDICHTLLIFDVASRADVEGKPLEYKEWWEASLLFPHSLVTSAKLGAVTLERSPVNVVNVRKLSAQS